MFNFRQPLLFGRQVKDTPSAFQAVRKNLRPHVLLLMP
jgi:hypothetical protein